MATEKKQSFFGGAAVLAAGVVIVKIIGALFKIPLANILSETGNADFNNAYNIYAVLLTISTAGLPVALSKMISEAKTLGRERPARAQGVVRRVFNARCPLVCHHVVRQREVRGASQ